MKPRRRGRLPFGRCLVVVDHDDSVRLDLFAPGGLAEDLLRTMSEPKRAPKKLRAP